MKETNTLKVMAIARHRINIDGKGVTTLVGLSGCPLNCTYCINQKALRLNKIREYNIDEMIQYAMQDYCYFVATGGGVTFGGGEPLLQIKAITEFMKQTTGLFNTNIETSLNVETDIDSLVELVNTLIIDIKSIDNKIYSKYTGLNNNILLMNLNKIVERKLQSKCKIRIPIIKGYTTKESVDMSIEYIKDLGFEDIDTFEYVTNT